jgi:AcrR family transcriptional regulator
MEVLMSDDAASVSVRRPRMTQARVTDLLLAALDALCEVGYEDLTMDQIASRARCSKATLYRLWPGKPQLIAAALQLTRPLKVEEIDTGTLRGDLLMLAELLAVYAERATALFSALAHAAFTDDELATAVRTTMVEPGFADLVGLVDRAVERGELPARPAATAFLPKLLIGVTITRPLFEGGHLADADYLTRCVEDVLLPALLHS